MLEKYHKTFTVVFAAKGGFSLLIQRDENKWTPHFSEFTSEIYFKIYIYKTLLPSENYHYFISVCNINSWHNSIKFGIWWDFQTWQNLKRFKSLMNTSAWKQTVWYLAPSNGHYPKSHRWAKWTHRPYSLPLDSVAVDSGNLFTN